MTLSIQLSANGLRNIPDPEIRKDFTFIVEGFEYHCSWHLAHFLSPMLCTRSGLDSTVDCFSIDTPGSHSIFGNIISLGHGERISLLEANRQLCSLDHFATDLLH
jgi:hypothetical protein